MYRGFNLRVEPEFFRAYVEDGVTSHQEHTAIARVGLGSFKDSSGKIMGSKVYANWFPQIDANVFISHAHKDSDLAIGLSGFLKYEFGISSFIDSCVWGYSGDLQKALDEAYCLSEDGKTYSYSKRNRSTAHVHMMLSVALSNMINNCECIIFLNTPQSIVPAKYIEDNATESPWIFAEIAMTQIIQWRSRSAHRKILEKAAESFVADSAVPIEYDVNLDHFTDLNAGSMQTWRERFKGYSAYDALDILYRLPASQ